MTLEQEVPIFSKAKKDFKPSDRITHVAIANKNLAMVQANGILFRMNLNNPQQCIEISLTKYTTNFRITNIFLDPTGNHLLLGLVPKSEGLPDLLYISKKSDKVKSTAKFKGNELTEVAWNILNESESGTGPILLGMYYIKKKNTMKISFLLFFTITNIKIICNLNQNLYI